MSWYHHGTSMEPPSPNVDVTNLCPREEGLGQSATNVNPVGTEERRTDGGTNCVAWRAHHVPRSISFTTPRQLYCLFPPPFLATPEIAPQMRSPV